MALKYVAGCKICKIIKGELPADGRITTGYQNYSSTYRLMEKYIMRRVTAQAIVTDYPHLSAENISRHCTRHQTVPAGKAAKMKVAEATIEEVKAEIVALNKRVSGMEQTKTDTSTLIEGLLKEVAEGNIQGKFSDLVRLLGMESKIHEKEKDQGISMMGLIAKYASGELERKTAPVQKLPDAS